ncbi:PREDICTED: uncharacterized protein LOC101820173 [Ficedula albicollis]|uniref:uncharacterized protein LOC101820173 n=1 Tax=Ficedula albicollis TaxID=59894 RepID=UPI00035A02B9|nr:PREDICTED: uncharacterized protein LOC101820173 [Ficedula albicollis]
MERRSRSGQKCHKERVRMCRGLQLQPSLANGTEPFLHGDHDKRTRGEPVRMRRGAWWSEGDAVPAETRVMKDLGPCFLLAFPVTSMETEQRAAEQSVCGQTDGRTDRRAGDGDGGAAPANTPRSASPRGTARETEARDGSGGPGRKATLAALGPHLENKSVTHSADPVLIAPRAPRRVSTALPAARGAPPAPTLRSGAAPAPPAQAGHSEASPSPPTPAEHKWRTFP